MINGTAENGIRNRHQTNIRPIQPTDQRDVLFFHMGYHPNLVQIRHQSQRTGVLFDILPDNDIVFHDFAGDRRSNDQRLSQRHLFRFDLEHAQCGESVLVIFLPEFVVYLRLLDLLGDADIVTEQVFLSVQAFQGQFHLLFGLVISLSCLEKRRRTDRKNGTSRHNLLAETDERLDDTPGKRRGDLGITGRNSLHDPGGRKRSLVIGKMNRLGFNALPDRRIRRQHDALFLHPDSPVVCMPLPLRPVRAGIQQYKTNGKNNFFHLLEL